MIIVDANAYFNEQLSLSLKKNKLSIHEQSHNYLIKLISKSLDPEMFRNFPYLVDIYKQYLEEESSQKKRDLTLFLGEYTLLISGIFPSFILRKNLSLSYYHSIGMGAYQSLGNNYIYQEIGAKFLPLSNVLSIFQNKKNESLLNLYEQWIQSDNLLVLEELVAKNIIPLKK